MEHAFAVFGGGIAPVCKALEESSVRLVHCRHEASAAFAAIESSLASGKLCVVVSTTGPGLTNLLTGMLAARWEGAKVLFLSGSTPSPLRGRWACQETSGRAPGVPALTQEGSLFHYAAVIESATELHSALVRITRGAASSQSFVAHLSLPMNSQTETLHDWLAPRALHYDSLLPAADAVRECVEILSRERFVVWAGFGAHRAADELLEFVERTGSYVLSTPRGKGAFPESHPRYLGTTGVGGHDRVPAQLRAAGVRRLLVLGSRLGEMSSFWLEDFIPPGGLIHVDLDPAVFGAAYPRAQTLGVRADCQLFLRSLLDAWKTNASEWQLQPLPPTAPLEVEAGPVRPSFLMQALQRVVVQSSTSPLMADAGNSFIFCNHYLRFDTPGRYRVSTGFGSMGHASAGVLGIALGKRTKAFAVVGDGAMLMLNEVNTAACYGIDAVWVVLNDGGYGMVDQGMRMIGWQPFQTRFPRVDFAGVARSMGADGVTVETERELERALERALLEKGPFVVDVRVDADEMAPAGLRNQSLEAQGVNVAPLDVASVASSSPNEGVRS